MAIEVIPKKAQVETSGSVNFLFYFSLILLLASLITLLTFFFLKRNSEAQLQEIKVQIAEKETAEKKNQEAQILLVQRRISDFLFLLDFRRENSEFFTFLERVTHPQVAFSKIDLKIQDGKVLLSGIAENPIVLGQQILLFQKENQMKNISLEKLSISKDGKINFDLDISFLSEKFKQWFS